MIRPIRSRMPYLKKCCCKLPLYFGVNCVSTRPQLCLSGGFEKVSGLLELSGFRGEVA